MATAAEIEIKKLADLYYAAQTTGVTQAVLDAQRNKVFEVTGRDNTAKLGSMVIQDDHMAGQQIIAEYGYQSGAGGTEFYENATLGTTPDDPGLKVYFDAVDKAINEYGYLESTEANMEEYSGKINPDTGEEYKFMVNDHGANAALIAQGLEEQGLTLADTVARSSRTNLQQLASTKAAETYADTEQKMSEIYGGNGQLENALQWAAQERKTKVDTTPKVVEQPVATVTGTNYTEPGQGQITGGDTGSITPPSYSSTPNIGVVTPTYGAGQTGTSETTIPTYEEGLKKQATQFQNRATCQATFYQPQTQAEKEAAGTAPAFENVLYRNRFGMSMYVQHINGIPSQPIPPGYFKVQQFTTQDQTQASAAGAQGQNQGGMIQGLHAGGGTHFHNDYSDPATLAQYNADREPGGIHYESSSNQAAANAAAAAAAAGNNSAGSVSGLSQYANATVNPALNYKPGGQVTAQADGTFVLTYPDGTTSQAYSSSEQAQQADNLGKTNLGIQTFEDYSQAQGYSPDLPGYDQTAVQNLYNSYVTDTYASQQAAEAAANLPPPEATVNQDFISGEQKVTEDELGQYQNNLAAQAYVAPGGAVAAAPTSYIDPNVYGSVVESTAGQAQATAPMVESDQVAQISAATTADTPQKIGASQVTPNYSFSDVQNATTGMTAAQSTGPTQTIDAAQQTGTSLSGLASATADSIDVVAPADRTMQTGETITGTGVDQAQVGAAFGTGEVQAASIQGELANLMQQFEGGDTPAWAAGSMRAASQMLAARGLGASSMAGQAVIQAAMEAALPIAQIDTANKQQVALFKAEQRAKFLQMDFDQAFQAKVMNAAKVSEIANMNFTAEQQIALENSRAANTMQLQNLSNSQALVMAEAAALSQMDTQNLNNRQQANVQNAQNFLQVDMSNLANAQQTALFKQQSLVNSLLTDQAAANAALQFNASSENQTNQFFANLSSSIGQFNAAQMNAMKQFNAGEVNSLLEFNANIQNQREMFNAQNYLVVAQANAQWRQNLATLNTAAANESNMDYAKTVNGLTMTALDQIWQRERDSMDYAFTGGENQADRALSLLLADMELESVRSQIDAQESTALGALLTKIFFKV